MPQLGSSPSSGGDGGGGDGSSDTVPALPDGTRVLIRGLLNRKDLNGRIGLIQSFDEKKQRYILEAESVAALLAQGLRVRPANVVDLADAPPTYDSGVEYGRLLLIKQHYHEAKEMFASAVRLDDSRCEAHFGLSSAFSALESPTRAAEAAMRSMARCEVGSRQWAFATAAAFTAIQTAPEDEIMEPDWWRDAELKRLSELVVTAAYELPLAHQMRAAVLRGGEQVRWVAGERTPSELAEADEALRRAANYARPDGPQSAEDGSAADLLQSLSLAAAGARAYSDPDRIQD